MSREGISASVATGATVGISPVQCSHTACLEPHPCMELQAMPLDSKLQQAVQEVLQTGRLTPLIKEELKWSIIARRHAEGKEDIQVEFKTPDHYELRPDELEKKEERKKRNRVAAKKCRDKKKHEVEQLLQEVEMEEKRNSQLREEVEYLLQEKARLQAALGQRCLDVH